jgi:hypothetical protein
VEQLTTVDQYAQRLQVMLDRAQVELRGASAAQRQTLASAVGD